MNYPVQTRVLGYLELLVSRSLVISSELDLSSIAAYVVVLLAEYCWTLRLLVYIAGYDVASDTGQSCTETRT